MRCGGRPVSVLALHDDRAAPAIDQPKHGARSVRGAAGAVAPEQGHQLALPTLEVHPVQNVRLAVPGLQIVDAGA